MYGLIRSHGRLTPVAGDRTSTDGIVKVSRELWLGASGAAAAIAVATQGRLFGEAMASATIGSFPLEPGDAPDRLSLGFRAGDRLTLHSGFTTGYGVKASPYVSASVFGAHGLTGSVQALGGYRSANVSYAASQMSLSASFATSSSGADWALAGSRTVGNRLWDFTATREGPAQDDIVRTRTARGASLLLGLERVVAQGHTRIGAIFGTSVPISNSSFFDLFEHPSGSGRAIGFGFTQRVSFAKRVAPRMIRLEHASAGQLFVDDMLTGSINAERDHLCAFARKSPRSE